MEKVRTIHAPDSSVIQRLEHALSMARRGEYLSIAIVGQTRDGIETGFAFNDRANPWALIGAMEDLKVRIVKAGDDQT